ncbi:hypothetical protein TELCIR_12424 [Teladorsagia circumcincta]|uniref:DNA2/NAM7 helicase-like C-terminal domain-containing protein n=1 Tax=Teladorsagia circumcincta TaxID=45464 RepID=A0A2G9U6S2_TELCI|nr:hypothetical protein TELCIR_12424 [Teladorsagia circumcincta]
MVVALVSYLQKQGIKLEKIAIITTYSAQQSEMREAVITHFGRTANDQPSVAVETVDSFQGKVVLHVLM